MTTTFGGRLVVGWWSVGGRWVVDRNTFRPPAKRYRTTCYKEWWSSGRKIRNLRMCAYTRVRTREAYTPHLPYLAYHPDVPLPNTTPFLRAN